MTNTWKLFLFLLGLGATTVWLAFFLFPDKNLYLIACDVGQGDAILATYGKTQVLVDGGPDSKVLECLSRHLPFWDKELEVVVNTHPQKDHFMGLVDVLKIYKVDTLVATPLDSSSHEYEVLKKLVGSKGIKVINPHYSQRLRVGLIHLDILWPTQEFLAENLDENNASEGAGVLGAFTSKKDPNEFSVVAVLRFGNFDALLTGDIGPKTEKYILDKNLIPDVEYIKIPHHGSKNGLTEEFLDVSTPEIAIISVGKNNSYGHPHEEVLKMLGERNIKTLRTDEQGDVIVISDGKKWRVDNASLTN